MSKPEKELEEIISIDSYFLSEIESIDHLIRVFKAMKKRGANTCSFVTAHYLEKELV